MKTHLKHELWHNLGVPVLAAIHLAVFTLFVTAIVIIGFSQYSLAETSNLSSLSSSSISLTLPLPNTYF